MLARFLLISLLTSLLAVAPGFLPAAEAGVDQTYAGPTVRDMDTFMDLMKRRMWNQADSTERDAAGRSVQDDFGEYLMSEPVLQEFEQLRARIVQAHGEDGVVSPALQASFESLLRGESCRYAAITSYWGPPREIAIREGMIRAMHERLKSDLPLEAELAELRKQGTMITRETLMQRLEACRGLASSDTPAWMREPHVARGDYEKLRARYAALIDAALADRSLQIRWLERDTPCPAPAPAREGDQKARVRSMPDASLHYPPLERALQIEGAVRVEVEWDATGCVTRAGVLSTSGSESLDGAALRTALEMTMDPVTVDGVPQAGGATLPVRFSLQPAAAQPQP